MWRHLHFRVCMYVCVCACLSGVRARVYVCTYVQYVCKYQEFILYKNTKVYYIAGLVRIKTQTNELYLKYKKALKKKKKLIF